MIPSTNNNTIGLSERSGNVVARVGASGDNMKRFLSSGKNLLVLAFFAASIAFTTSMFLSTDEVKPVDGVSPYDVMAKKNEITESGTNTLSGMVRINGKLPLPHGTVMAFGSESPKPIGTSKIESGAYSIPGLREGRVQILVLTRETVSDKKSPFNRQPASAFGTPATVNTPSAALMKPKSEQAVEKALGKNVKGGFAAVCQKIDLLYGSFASERKIFTFVAEGQNDFNIDLELNEIVKSE